MTGSSTLIMGFARTGQAVARTLRSGGASVIAVDDHPSHHALEAASALDVELVVAPDSQALAAIAARCDMIVVSPGVAPTHAVFSTGAPARIVSEIELAFELGTPPIVAVTGTNGKTTVTSLVADMLQRSGLNAGAFGNIGSPLIETVGSGLDLVVAEVSSFQLSFTSSFRPKVATWLNFSLDHLDWHATTDEYAGAKARIWRNQQDGDFAVANIDDPVVWSYAEQVHSTLASFGSTRGDFHIEDDRFVGPGGEELATFDDLTRNFPHDRLNALAAIATAKLAGASNEGWIDALHAAGVLPHRVESIATIKDVEYFDDSKATTPSAVVAALQAFSSVVLIAGGRNKGLDFGEIRRYVEATPDLTLRGVVAIGEAAPEVADAFSSSHVVEKADSMKDAVARASELAHAGDVVLLSPGCASFDWYTSYEARGIDFVNCVEALRANTKGSR